MVKFLALDIDGVLNTGAEYDLEAKLIRNLKTIIDKTDANIILTSSWKEDPLLLTALRASLANYNVWICAISEDKVYDRFTSLFKKLDKDFKHYQCVVLDDEKFDYDNLTENQKQCFVFTNMSEGLTREKANEVIEKFNV